MTAYDFVHLALLAADGPVKGRTKLQKTIYFLGLLTNQVEGLGYRAHYYGPYSEAVAEALLSLESLGFVAATTAGVGATDPQGFEIRRTDYQLTDGGRRIAEQKRQQNAAFFEQLRHGIELLKRAGDLDYVRLSIAAKASFLLRQKNAPATEQELPQLARNFGWAVTEQQIREGLDYLKKLNLAKAVPAIT